MAQEQNNIDFGQQLAKANDLNKQLQETFNANRNLKTTAEEQTNILNKQSEAAYQQQRLDNQKAQNQFYQNQQANQLSALDAIRRSNASAIANGANAGLSAANELSAILGLQEETSDAATELANTNIADAAAYNEQLNKNAVTGMEQANTLNATLDANAAELAKALATNADTIIKAIIDERNRISNENQAEANRTSQEKIAGVQEQTDEKGNVTYTTPAQVQNQIQQEADTKAAKEAETQRINTIINDLNSLTAKFIPSGDKHTYVTSYYHPVENKIVDVTDEKMRKKEVDQLVNIINANIKDAQDNNDTEKLNEWLKKAEMFTSSLKYQDDTCLAPGTLITLADGTMKPVEDIQDSDILLVWDITKGELTAASVMFVEHDEESKQEVIKLTFSDNTTVEFIYEHGFFNTDTCKYIYLHNAEEAKQYINKDFLKYNGTDLEKIKLVSVTSETRVTTTHSPCTVRHLCLFANGLLTMPGNTAPFTNVFSVDIGTYKYNEEDIIKCTELYGAFTPEDFAGLLTPEIFYAFQGEYLKTNICKGATSMKEIEYLIQRYSEYLNK